VAEKEGKKIAIEVKSFSIHRLKLGLCLKAWFNRNECSFDLKIYDTISITIHFNT
jgi:hypothetical protein